MSGELTTEELQAKIAELTKENEKLKKENNNANDDNFQDIKNKYEEIIEEKNQEITNLQKKVDDEKKKVNDTVDTLKDEVQAKLDANEEYQKLLKTVEDLEKEKAETTVDTLIKQGKIVPAQKEIALDFCLKDADKFAKYYENAKPVIDVSGEQQSKKAGKIADKLSGYF